MILLTNLDPFSLLNLTTTYFLKTQFTASLAHSTLSRSSLEAFGDHLAAVMGCLARNETMAAAVSRGFSSPMACPAAFMATSVMRSPNSSFIGLPFSGGAVLSPTPWTISIDPLPPAHHCSSGVFLFASLWERRASGQYFSALTKSSTICSSVCGENNVRLASPNFSASVRLGSPNNCPNSPEMVSGLAKPPAAITDMLATDSITQSLVAMLVYLGLFRGCSV